MKLTSYRAQGAQALGILLSLTLAKPLYAEHVTLYMLDKKLINQQAHLIFLDKPALPVKAASQKLLKTIQGMPIVAHIGDGNLGIGYKHKLGFLCRWIVQF